MNRSIHGLFVAFVLVVVLREVGIGVDSGWLVALHLVVFGLLIAVVASLVSGLRVDGRRALALVGLQVLLAVLAGAGVVYHARVEGVGFQGLAVIYLAMIGVTLTHSAGRGALKTSLVPLLGYVLLTGVFLQHVLDVPPTSGLALFPVFAAVVLGLCLFVIPRYVAQPVFHRSLVAIAMAFAVVGLLAGVVGEYTIGGLEIALWGERSLPFVDRQVPIIQSVFVNPNTLGLVVFSGLVAAVVECHRVAIERRSDWGLVLVPVIVLLGVALYLTNSRGSMLAVATGVTIYGAYVLLGRRGIPVGVAIGYGGALAALLAVFVLFPGTDGQRGTLWSAGLEAYLASPTLLGEGLVGTGELIGPYLDDPGSTVHNSYLSVLLRTGLVGIVGYLLVVVAPTIHGAIRRRTVSPGALALAGAFVIHQFFEGYTIYQYDFGAVLGALAAGYLIVSLGRDTGDTDPDRAGSTTSDAR